MFCGRGAKPWQLVPNRQEEGLLLLDISWRETLPHPCRGACYGNSPEKRSG